MSTHERLNRTKRMKNTSYIFVPFFSESSFNNTDVKNHWRMKTQGNKYFLKYIVEKLTHDSNNVCCRPYLMDDSLRKKLGIIESSQLCHLETMQYSTFEKGFSFFLNEILMFLFETNIGFIIYKIEHSINDTYEEIASKNYHLKKIHDTLLYTDKADGTKATLVAGSALINSLSLLTEYVIGQTMGDKINIFFNYNSKSERRSNILTHFNLNLDHMLGVKDNKDIENILFHLKRNYHREWQVERERIYNKTEYFKASSHIRWGISSEATICLTITDPNTFFVGNSFYDNFHSYYLYEYVLVLHQKYALYYFLTDFSFKHNLDELEVVLIQLASFKAKYVFKIISESETYQTIYSRQCKVFALDKLFSDIDGQVNRVLEIRKNAEARKRVKQENRISLILGFIAFLGLFSALNDMNLLIDWLDWIFNASQIALIQRIATGILLFVSLIFVVLFVSTNSKKRKNKKERDVGNVPSD